MKRVVVFVIWLTGITIYAQSDSLTITEIMFRPDGTNNEFIEIYNYSETVTYNLASYKIIYMDQNPDIIESAGEGTWLPPESYAIILEKDYNFNSGTYNNIIPNEAVMLQINSNSFGNNGLANSSDRTIKFVNSLGDTLSIVSYTANNNEGYSDEKLIISGSDEPENWGNSISFNGTPGSTNSITPKEHDLAIEYFASNIVHPADGDEITISAKVKNIGASAAGQFEVVIAKDANGDSIITSNEIIFSESYQNINSGDSLVSIVNYTIESTAVHNFICRVNYSPDEFTSNNIAHLLIEPVIPPTGYGGIVINELQFAPQNGEPEWIELYNVTDTAVNLRNWQISDLTSSRVISEEDLLIESGDHLILADDISIVNYYPWDLNYKSVALPSLNNTGDEIKLLDYNLTIVDSINYIPEWSSEGKSLERVSSHLPADEDNTSACRLHNYRGTPGLVNSVSIKEYDLELTSVILSNNYAYINSPIDIDANITNYGTVSGYNATIEIYHDTNNDNTASVSELIYDDNFTVQTNNNLIVASLVFASTGAKNLIVTVNSPNDELPYNDTLYTTVNCVEPYVNKGDILINEIMFAPASDEPEWIEVYNNSDGELNIANFRICDENDTNIAVNRIVEILPGEFVVIAADSGIVNHYSHEINVIVGNLPTLNNNGDKVILLDSLNNTIDSVSYYDWEYARGLSLERVNYNVSSSIDTNWRVCSHPDNATPGLYNSVSPVDIDAAIMYFNYERDVYAADSNLVLELGVRNLGTEMLPASSVKIFIDANDNNVADNDEIIETIGITWLESSKSSEIIYMGHPLPAGEYEILALWRMDNDKRPWNNFVADSVKVVPVNEDFGDIVINEFMCSPADGLAEWIEFYNRSEKSIDINGYQIADSRDTITAVNENQTIKPGEFFIFASDSSIGVTNLTGNYLYVSGLPTLNNNGDKIVLLDSLGRVIDSLTYNSNFPVKRGVSTERISPDSISYVGGSWALCQHPVGLTPFDTNSVFVRDYNISLENLFTSRTILPVDTTLNFSFTVINTGKNIARDVQVIVRDDSASGSILSQNISSIMAGKSVTFNGTHSYNNPGTYNFNAEIKYPSDQVSWNNRLATQIKVVQPTESNQDIIINEFMPNPLTGRPEWIELYNNSRRTINLKNYNIADSRDTVSLTRDEYFFNISEYLVISSDSSLKNYYSGVDNLILTNLPVLNNDTDKISVMDSLYSIIDTVTYGDNSGITKGYSLERISTETINNPDSVIFVSTPGGTPGKINSIAKKEYDFKIDSARVTPQPLLYGSIYNLFWYYSNIGKQDVYITRVQVYINGELAAPESYFNQIRKVEPGINYWLSLYELVAPNDDSLHIEIIYTMEQDDDLSNNSYSRVYYISGAPEEVTISEIMYNPITDYPEWIELHNNTNHNVNLKGWKLVVGEEEERLHTLAEDDYNLPPNQFFVLSDDSTGLKDVSYLQTQNITMPNTTTKLTLRDPNYRVIHSLEYSSVSPKGVSLEYCDNCTINLNQSFDPAGATPGKINSIAFADSADFNDIVINEIYYDCDPSLCKFIEIYNNSDKTFNLNGWRLGSGDNSYISNKTVELPPNEYFTVSRDSLLLNYVDPYLCDINNVNILASSTANRIILVDPFAHFIDSLTYSPNWHLENSNTEHKSLERILPSGNSDDKFNWSTSVALEGYTPGKQNSIFISNPGSESGITITPNPFSPDNDGFEDFASINYNLAGNVNKIRARVFDSKGRLVRTLTEDYPSAKSGSIVFDGYNDSHNPLRIGIYIIFFEAMDGSNNVIETYKKAIVVARKL